MMFDSLILTHCPGTIAIGVTPYNYPLSSQPGWSRGSAAYHADDGK